MPERSFAEELSRIRHDMRTPTGHILGYAEMLEEDHADGLSPEAVRDLRSIQACGQQLIALIDDVLGSGKASAAEIDLTDAQHRFRAQLNDIAGYADMIREEARERGMSDLVADLDHIFEAERTLLSLIESKLTAEALVAAEPAPEEAPPEEVEEEAPVAEPASPDEAERLGEGGEILVVDDDPANRELLMRRLERQGYKPSQADGGEAALKHLHERGADLVLLDLIMPGMDGLETLQRIKGDPALRSTPVVMLSAADDVNQVVRCIAAGAEDFIPKPFNSILLRARIGAVLEKHRLRHRFARQLRVFISSPGDVIAERRAVKEVIGRLNDELGGRAFLVPMLWEEEPLLASDTFQAQINSPGEADIYVGIFWSRIGSMLPDSIVRQDGSRYESGTAYEFEVALAGFEERRRPDILVYRRQGAPTMSLEDRDKVQEQLDQMERLERYLDGRFRGSDGSYRGAFHTFSTLEEFETMVATHLRKLVDKRLEDGETDS